MTGGEFSARIPSMRALRPRRYAACMKNSHYRIVPLPTALADAARQAGASGAPDHEFVVTDSPETFPCRHCLRWAQPGERLVLFPFAAIAPGRPYSETGPVFVHAEECERYSETSTYPPDFRSGRVLRAYDAKPDVIDAIVVEDGEPEPVIEKLLANPQTAFIHVRSTTRGCYTMAIERV